MFKFHPELYTDIRIEKKVQTIIQKTNYQLDDISVITTNAAFIRVYNGNLWYYASTDKIANIQETLDKLYEKISIEEKASIASICSHLEINQEEKLLFQNQALNKIPLNEKLNILENYEKIYQANTLVKFIISKYSDNYFVYEFYSSLGSRVIYDSTICGLSYTFVLLEETKAFEEVYQTSTMNFEELKHQEEAILKHLEKVKDFLENAKQVEAGYYPVVLSPLVAGVFAHESFGHKSEADFMMNDQTLEKEWFIGKTIGSPALSIIDDGELLYCGYTPYDDEGTKSKKTYLIKNGKLTDRLHNSQTAFYLKESLTGNARATSCQYEPIVRMTNTYIANGTEDPQQIIQRIKKGYYIEDLKHGSGMSQFTIAPMMAYEIIDGKIAAPVLINAIIGNVFETLGDIDGIGNDLKLNSFVHAGCGKMDQLMLPVGFGGPTISIKKMLVI